MNILEQIAEYTKERIGKARRSRPLDQLKAEALSLPSGDFAFQKALAKDGLSFICECKKASPSKGLIEPDYKPVSIASDYEKAGADCISVLTEPHWFLGSDEHLKRITETVSIPVLRKDFTIDEYMIYEAASLRASAVLLICSLLEKKQMEDYINICRGLGLSALVEAHDEYEIETALDAGAGIIGVNNRNLKDFSVDTGNAAKLRNYVPEGILFVSESGVKGPEDIRNIRRSGADAVLIGETLMRAEDKSRTLADLKGES